MSQLSGSGKFRETWGAPLLGVGIVSVVVVLLVFLFGLRHANLLVSFGYQGDGLLSSSFIQTLIEKGSYLQTDRLGAPYGQTLYDFPMSDGINFLVLWLFGATSQSWALTMNAFFLLTFPLVALTSFFALRRMGVADLFAAVLSVLYAFLPYHLGRGEMHLFLSAYYMVPLFCWVLWEVAQGDWAFEVGKFRHRRFWTFALICLLGSSTGIYYAFFAALALFFFSVVGWIETRNTKTFVAGVALLVLIALGTFVNLLPTILHSVQNQSAIVTHRSIGESEIYGLKLAQLILPRTGHNFAPFAFVRDVYNRSSPLVNENDMVSLGVIGAFGLLFSLGALFVRGRGSTRPLALVGKINVFLILVATVGGLAIVIGFVLTTEIRAYNRISVFIAFFSFAAVGLVLTPWYGNLARLRWRRVLVWCVAPVVLGLGLYDQIPLHSDVSVYVTKVSSDRDFFTRVERVAGPNANIYQLPYMPFPESPPIYHMNDYEHLRGYLNSRSLRWSYGAFKGSEGDRLSAFLGKESDRVEFANHLVLAGFSGVSLNRDAYPDDGKALEARLTERLGAPPLVSLDGRLAYFDLNPLKDQLTRDRVKFQAQVHELAVARGEEYLLGNWISGFEDQWLTRGWSPMEPGLRWTLGSEARVSLSIGQPVNASELRLTLEPVAVLGTQTIEVSVNGHSVGQMLFTSPGAQSLTFASQVLVAPGTNVIRLGLPAAARPGNGDPRRLSFALGRMKLDSEK